MVKSSGRSAIRLRGVRQNNLKNFDLDLPLNKLIVVTGLSGSGKSSLAFDTLFAEGQRRYIETFSPYARQFLDRMDKPQVDSIEGIPPAIAIEQRNAVRTTRSTVGTMTELCDYMKMLWPHIAQLHCRQCGKPVRKDSPQMVWETVKSVERGAWSVEHGAAGAANTKHQTPNTRETSNSKLQTSKKPQASTFDTGFEQPPEFLITFDVPLSDKLSFEESIGLVANRGYQRLLMGGQIVRLAELEKQGLTASRSSSLTVVQDRLRASEANRARFIEACEQAYHFGKGKLAVHFLDRDQPEAAAFAESPQMPSSESRFTFHVSPYTSHATRNTQYALRFSNRLHCAECDIEYSDPSPALFSFNHPAGACPTCRGFGRIISIDYDLVIPDRSRTLAQGVVKPWLTGHGLESHNDLMRVAKHFEIPTNVPFEKLSKKWQDFVIEGEPDHGKDEEHQWPRSWYGVKGYFRWLESKAYKMHVRVMLSRYRAYTPCPDCQGRRFRPEALLYKVQGPKSKAQSPRPTVQSPQSTVHSPRSTVHSPQSGPPEGPCLSGRSGEGFTIGDFYALPVRDALCFIEELRERRPFQRTDPLALVLGEIRSRLHYLDEVGLGYLTLDRPTRTLSGGETERVNLTTCLGTRLVNTLFVLDEPSVGLHSRDTERLVRILKQLRDAGNTVVVVEHEPGVIRAADQIVDLGPGHGASGGQVVFQGAYRQILASKESLTGEYLSGRKQISTPVRRAVQVQSPKSKVQRQTTVLAASAAPVLKYAYSAEAVAGLALNDAPGPSALDHRAVGAPERSVVGSLLDPQPSSLRISHATSNNLRDLSVEIPLGRFVCITGVSGSGKTTLLREVLLPALSARLKSVLPDTKASDRLSTAGPENGDDADSSADADSGITGRGALVEGCEELGRVVLVDQAVLGKTPRSNPAVYIGAFDDIREFFAQSEGAKQRGLNASAFSFNSAQGQCERCRGAGFEKIEMQFLSDVFIRCPECNGRRYREHILKLRVSPSSYAKASENKKSKAQSPKSRDEGRGSRVEALSIADVLESTVDEVIDFLDRFPESNPGRRARQSLALLQEVGLGYLKLGQPINTLSGGESQRLKLVRHLAEVETEPRRLESAQDAAMAAVQLHGTADSTGARTFLSAATPKHSAADVRSDAPASSDDAADRNVRAPVPAKPILFLFDEPTTGLHFDDVRLLLKVFQRLVYTGHSVLVIEHNLEVIKSADWIIDLGPEAGDHGGEVVVTGTPETVAQCTASHTGRALREVLRLEKH